MEGLVPLSSLKPGEVAVVAGLDPDGADRGRLLDLGFTPGSEVECLFSSPMGDPIAYRVRGAVVALRRRQSDRVWITAPAGAGRLAKGGRGDG